MGILTPTASGSGHPGNWSYWSYWSYLSNWSGGGVYLDAEGAVEEVDREQSRVEIEEVRDPLHKSKLSELLPFCH